MDIIFFVYGLAFLVMGLVIVILRDNESHLELSGILWLLAAFGFSHGLLEWSYLWSVVRGDHAVLAAAQPAFLLISYLFLFEFGRRLMLIALPDAPRANTVRRLLGVWVYAPLLGVIIGCMAFSAQPALAVTIGARYLAGFSGSLLASAGLFLYWRNRLASTTLNVRVVRIGNQLGAITFIAYAILGGLIVPRADWFPASTINQESFFDVFHVPVQLPRAACALLVAISVGAMLRVFQLEKLQRLQASEARLNLATTAGNIGIWDWDVARNELLWDDSMYQLYGIHRQDFSNAYAAWSAALHPDDRQHAEGEIHAALLGERDFSAEFRIVRPDGGIRHIRAAASTFRDPQGNPLRMIGTNIDITELKQAEEGLLLLNETLEQQVNEQTQQNIDKERLLVEQSRNAAMGEMIRNIAHQWRQPLNAVALSVQNIREDFRAGRLTSEELERDVDSAMRCVTSMSRTIDDFRNFFRTDKARIPFNLHRAIEEALHILGATLKNNDIEVTLSGDKELQAFGYPNEFSQVILNLLANAADALVENNVPRRKIEIELGTTDHAARVVIRDNGGGIPAETTGKIFEPYFTTKINGTGIGLYMSRIIIDKHMGGSLTCRNTAEGAEFSASIPQRASDVTEQAALPPHGADSRSRGRLTPASDTRPAPFTRRRADRQLRADG